MTIQHDYKTTSSGAIDYAHYTRRAHEIRNEDACKAIDAIGRGLAFLGAMIWRQTWIRIAPMTKAARGARTALPAGHRTPA